MKKSVYKILFFLSLFVVNSCNLENFDFKKLSKDIDLSPEFVAPIAKADISVWDIIESVNNSNDTLFKKGDNNIIKLVYQKKNIYKYSVSSFLNLPSQKSLSGTKTIGSISANNTSVNRNVTIRQLQEKLTGDIDNLTSGAGVFPDYDFSSSVGTDYSISNIDKFTSVTVETGSFDITITNNLVSTPFIIGGTLVDITSGQTIATFTATSIDPNSTETKTFLLNGKTISNNLAFRLTKFQTFSSGFPEDINLDSSSFNFQLAFKNLKISAGRIKIDAQTITGYSGSFDFNLSEGIKVFEAGFTYGTLNFSSINNSGFAGRVNLTFPGIKDSRGTIMSVDVPFNGSNNTKTLAGAVIDMTMDPAQRYNKVKYEYSIDIYASVGYVNFNSNDAVSVTVNMGSMQFKYVKGDFGNKVVAIPNGSFAMDSQFWDKITGDFKLVNPIFNLKLTNSIGVPARVNANFVAQNKSGQTVSLDRGPFTLLTPSSLTGPAVKQTVPFNKTNSNIVEFIALPPSGNITYSGNVSFNPDGAVTLQNPNFFNLTDSLKMDIDIELPFEMQINNLSFVDTMKIEGENFDKIKTAQLIINAVNGIPLDIDVQLSFIDTISGREFSSMAKSRLLSAAQITDAGVITATTTSNTLTLNEVAITGLRQANGIVLKGYVSSPSSGTKTAVIYSTSRLDVNVVLKSKIEL